MVGEEYAVDMIDKVVGVVDIIGFNARLIELTVCRDNGAVAFGIDINPLNALVLPVVFHAEVVAIKVSSARITIH